MTGDDVTPRPDAAVWATAFRQTIERILALLPEPTRHVLRLAAISHWFDPALLQELAGPDQNVEEFLAWALDLSFVTQDSEGRFRYHITARESLLDWWRRERPDEYQSANESALSYFLRLANGTQGLERQSYEREVLYHQLVVDEGAGLKVLRSRFEEARSDYQLAVAEGLVGRALELTDSLTDTGRAWVRYFKARLDLAYRRDDLGESGFSDLASNAPDPLLAAIARRSLGEIALKRQDWSAAVQQFRSSLARLQRMSAGLYAGRVMIALGDAYRDLAENSGGLQVAREGDYGLVSRTLYVLQHLPFLLGRWIALRVNVPTWYFSTNYQNWIIASLLVQGARWYQRAERQLHIEGDERGLVEAQMHLAYIEHQLGSWPRARRRYAGLLTNQRIRDSQYRTAQAEMGLGRALLREGDATQAVAPLSSALPTFRRFHDENSIGTTSALLGRALAVLGRTDEAITALTEGLRAFDLAGDQLARTRAAWELEDLAQQPRLSQDQRRLAQGAVAGVRERHYITRFSAALLVRFRRLALLVALPLSYIVSFLVGLGLALFMWAIEVSILLTLTGEPLTLLQVLIFVASAGLICLLPLWLYHGTYSLAGTLAAYILGRQLSPIEQEQPGRLVTDDEGLKYYGVDRDLRWTATWPDMTTVASVDYYQWHRPIHLISNTLLAAGAEGLLLEGITVGYERLKQDIAVHLAGRTDRAKQLRFDFVIFDPRWALVSSAIALICALVLWLGLGFQVIGYLQESQQEVTTVVTPIMLSFVLTLLLIFPAVVLWRLLAHRLAVQRVLGYRARTIPTVVMWLAAVGATLGAALWIILLIVFTRLQEGP